MQSAHPWAQAWRKKSHESDAAHILYNPADSTLTAEPARAPALMELRTQKEPIAMRLLATFIVATLIASTPSHSENGVTLAPDGVVDGKSQAEWSRRWWQWAGSFAQTDSPIADRTGHLCANRQSGPVWFLAGTYGAERVIRTCHVPRGKMLFFPLINYVVMPNRAGSNLTCPNAIQTAREITNDPELLILEVDGKPVSDLERHRQATVDCFDMGANSTPHVQVSPSAANGYYAMLQPPSPGRHTLNFGGILPGMSQAVTYTLIVE